MDVYGKAVQLFGALKLPPVQLSLRESRTAKAFDVYDPLRRKWVVLTPEEWVRQHFVNFMVNELNYSPFRMSNEVFLRLNNTSRRADTVVYDNNLKPKVVVEYKAADIDLTPEVLDQVLRYNLVFRAPTVVITNGMDVYTAVEGKLYHSLIL